MYTYLFDITPPRDPFTDYNWAIRFNAPLEPLGIDEFNLLPASEQETRRRLARDRHDRALALRRTVVSWWNRIRSNPGGFNPTGIPPDLAIDGMGMALGHLVTATGLDPGGAEAWYDLSALYELVGDTDRAGEARTGVLDALDHRSSLGISDPRDMALRQRVLLDRAWAQRHAGYFQQASSTVFVVADLLRDDPAKTPDLALEARILHALSLVETGRTAEALSLANGFPEIKLPRHQNSVIADTEAYRAVDKRALESVESNFAARWVRAAAHCKLDNRARALDQFLESDYRTAFPPHLDYRFWQDAGRIQEHFGEVPAARLSYVFGIVRRPLLIYYSMTGARGRSSVYGQAGSGRLYFLAYRHYFVGGSLFSYAANRVLAVEAADPGSSHDEAVRRALEALDACERWKIRPASTMALRGRVHYRAGMTAEAMQDLLEARERMKDLGRHDADVNLLLGSLQFNANDYAEAAGTFSEYTGLRPKEGLGWRLLGLALIHAGQMDQALAALDRSLEIEPDAPAGLYNRALLHIQTGNPDLARKDLDRALRKWPDNPDFVFLADLLERGGKTKVTVSHDPLNVAVEFDDALAPSSDQEPGPVLIMGRSAGAFERLGMNTDQAQAVLAKLGDTFERDPSPAHRADYAWALLQVGKAGEAVALLAPHWETGMGSDELAILLRAERELGEVTHARMLVMGLNKGQPGPDDPEIWELVGAICLENGAPRAAAAALGRAYELDPGNAHLGRLVEEAERGM